MERATAPPLKCIIRNVSQTLFYHALFKFGNMLFHKNFQFSVGRKMDALAMEFPDTFRLIRQTEISKTYEIPKRLVRIGKPRELSSAQKENLAKMRDAKRQVRG